MNAKIAETKEWFQELNKIKLNIEEVKSNAVNSLKFIESEKEESENVAKNIKEILTIIEGYERETGNAKNNADSSASSAKINSDSVATLVADLKDSIERKDELFKEFADIVIR
jgi:uncharacterized coiled-coil DUF342 family protein